MATIPMNIVGPKITDPAQQLGQIIGLQHLATQNRLAQEDLKRTQLQNDQLARSAAAEKTIGTLLSQNTTVGDDGMPRIDHVAVSKGLADAGFGQEALKVNGQLNADAKAAYDRQQSQAKAQAEQFGLIGQTASSIIGQGVNWQEKDPQKLQMDIAQAQARFQTGIKDLVQKGVVKPEEAAQLAQLDQNGYNPQLEDQIKFIAKRGMTAAQQSEALHRDLTDKRAQILGNVELTGKQLENVTKELDLFGRQAGSIINQDTWTEARSKLSPEAQSRIPEIYNADAVKAAKAMATTVAQDEAAKDRQERQEDLRQNRDIINAQRDESIALSRSLRSKEARESGLTANAANAYRRDANKQFRTAVDAESTAYLVKQRLESALKPGDPTKITSYVNDKGAIVPIEKVGGDQSKDDLIADMKNRLENMPKTLHSITDEKYDAMDRLDTNRKYTREQVHAAIDGKPVADQSGSGQTAAPAATPKPTATAAPAPAAGGSSTVVVVNGKKFTFKTKADADKFKTDAGIK